MGFSWTRFTAILFFVVIILVQSFGNLIVLRHPWDTYHEATKLTCISEDDDSALIWNYNFQPDGTDKGDILEFQPQKLATKNVSECAIWNSVNCIANWEQPFQWDVTNSAKRPTSPVFDYRWEGFKEFVFEETTAEHKYVDTGNVEGDSGTVVFSVRALQDVKIFLCKKKNVEKNRCFWISIGRDHGRQSKIFNCVDGALKPRANEKCNVIAETRHDTAIVDAFEWRTFRIEWKSEEQTVKLFKETELEPFLEGIEKKWHSVSHIFLSSEISSRVRFHFYDYILTEKKNTELFTQHFRQENRDFCIELLVGLCSDCQLIVSLIDESGHPIAANSISGNKDSANSALLSWKSIKLLSSLESSMPKFVKLKIKTILNGTKGTGQWAVDNIRVCKLDDSLRRSTITTRQEEASPDLWPIVKCQKISYSESAIVDSRSTNKIHYETSRLLQLVRKSEMFDSYRRSDEKWFICNPSGCACDRGYKGANCATECSGGSYGYDCNEVCGSCFSGNCDVVNGNCNTGCRSDRFLPPFCKELEEPTIENITDTTAILFQKVEPELFTYIINFHHVITELSGRRSGSILGSTIVVRSTYIKNFSQLRPGTKYRVHTIVTTKFDHTFENTKIGGNVTVQSPEIIFTTTTQRCLKVVPNKNRMDLSLQRDVNLEGCEAFSNRPYYIEMKGPANFYLIYGDTYLPLRCGNLDPYTEYELFVSRDGIPVWTKKVRTLPSAPERVRNLRLPYISDTKVILQWDVPLKRNGVITKYNVSIKRITLCGCQDLGKQTPIKDETIKEVKDTIASFSGLNPYANYRAAVIAHTTEPGSENTIEFQTLEADIQTSVVTNLELISNQNRLKWDKPEDCLKITASITLTRLVFTGVSDSVQNWTINRTTTFDYFDLFELHLAHYTTYNVRVYVLKSNGLDVNPDLYREMNWTTAPTAPSPIENLDAYDTDPDTNTISLRWEPPDPANGEIESYYVTIDEASPIKEWTVKASEGMQACEYWENHVCIENLTLRSDAPNVFLVKIYARNKNVEAAGSQATFYIAPGLDYNKAPGVPMNLTAIHEGHGKVIVTWMHPSDSKTKITRFEIIVNILKSNLLENLNMQYLTVNHSIVKNQKYYSEILSLRPSTNYEVSVVAINRRSQKSSPIKTEVFIPTCINFVTENKPLVNFDGTSIAIKIPTVVNATSNTTVEIIVKGLSKCAPKSSPQTNETRSVMEWGAAVYQVGNEIPESLKIYAGKNEAVSLICFLDLKETYTIVFNVTDWYSGTSVINITSPFALSSHGEPGISNFVWLAVLPVLAGCALVLFICHRNRQRFRRQPRQSCSYVEPISVPRKPTSTNIKSKDLNCTQELKPSIPGQPSYLELIPYSPTTTSINGWTVLNNANNSPQTEAIEDRWPDHVYTVPNTPDFCCVSIEDFPEYAKNAATSRRLFSQFMLFPEGLTRPCEYGRLPENMPKNRNEKSIAYDHSRVVLKRIPGDPHSDYINASHIKVYEHERTYIAAQGPMPNTVNDFWRMIWQEEVRVICMLTNIIEGGETKCEKYWPDVGTWSKYGDFHVSNTNDQVYADYTLRIFELRYEQHTRKIKHLHYTGWPNLGVPTYFRSLVDYLRKLEQTPDANGPVVVHCSTGDDRTGTIILCAICLRQAVAEKIIDVMAVIFRMRESRANMVGTLRQYVLAHIIISDSLVSWPTQIPCADVLSNRINELRFQLPSDMKRLNDTMWQLEALQFPAASSLPTAEYLTNDEIPELVQDRPEVIYDDVFESERNRINAVNVDGVKTKKQYLACWLPSPLTLPNFWEFVVEREIKLIIILQCSDPRDSTCRDIIPDETIAVPSLKIEVENQTSLDEGDYFTNEKLLLTDTTEENARLQSLTVLTCKGWGCGTIQTPPTPTALISLWRTSERIPRNTGQTLVLCHNGITGCGLYLALSFLLERMAVERECDVVSAVRAVRRSKPEFVHSREQFEYLYDAAVKYVESFQPYANFS